MEPHLQKIVVKIRPIVPVVKSGLLTLVNQSHDGGNILISQLINLASVFFIFKSTSKNRRLQAEPL